MTLAPIRPEATAWWQPLMAPSTPWATVTARSIADQLHAARPQVATEHERARCAVVVESLVQQAVRAVATPGAPAPTPVEALPAEMEAAIETHVESGTEVIEILHRFRQVQEILGEALLELVDRHGSVSGLPAELRRVSRRFTAHMNAVALLIVAHHERADRAWRGRADRRRDQLIAALLAGEKIDPVEAGRVLGHSVLRRHLALVVRVAAPTATDVITEWLRAADAPRSLVVGRGATCWAWVPARDPEALLSQLSLTAPPGVHAGAGMAAAGQAGFRSSHLEAEAAVHLAVRRDEPLVRFRDVELDLLLGADMPAAQAFVRRELGALAGHDPFVVALRRTLLVYLTEGRSVARTAARLQVARNTVSYRVKRASEVLGRSVDLRRLELECALRIAEDGSGPARP